MSNDQGNPNPWPTYGQSGDQQPSQSPWPVYGQSSGSAPGNPQSPYGQTPQTPGSRQTGPQQPASNPYTSGGESWPAGAQTPYARQNAQPSQQAYSPASQPGSGPFSAGQGATAPLPSRTGPIWTIVLGAVMMLVIAPITLFSLLLSGVGISSVVEESMNVENSGTVVVDESGAVGVLTTSSDPISCTVTGASGTAEMTEEVNGAVLVARGLTPGEYTLACEGLASTDQIVVLSGSTLDRLAPASMSAFGWSSAVGVAGFIVMIVGIVWLVRRNQQRNAMRPRNYGYGYGYGR